MTVSFDHRAILINGERTLILSGAVHYPRSTPEMWPRIFRHMRRSGINTVETYVFWNLHERKRGVLDFSGRLDLVKFCRLAQKEGLFVILRIGPYVCAETNYGGFPGWLRDVPGIRMRTDNDAFKREKARWVYLVSDIIYPLTATNGGPVILAQIENEYDNIAATYGEAGKRYLRWSVDLANSLSLGIPWMTCAAGGAAEAGEKNAVASTGGTIETLNQFRAHEIIDRHVKRNPEQPALWTENWIGWYQTWGGVLPKRDPAELAWATARFFAAGGTGVNYYLWHGGTNFNREGMYLLTTSFEFGGALDEYGLPSTKAKYLERLNKALLLCSKEILESDRPKMVPVKDGIVEFRYESGLRFVCNDAARSLRIIRGNGKVVYDSATPIAPVRRSWKSSGVKLGWRSRPEPMPEKWTPETRGNLSAAKPVEQLLLTRDETDYCWYETDITVSAKQAASGKSKLLLNRVADVVHVFIDGKFAATTHALPLLERRGKMSEGRFTQSFEINLRALKIKEGKHRLSLLCCALGLIKGDWMIGYENMALEKKGLWAPVEWDGKQLKAKWAHQPGLFGEQAEFWNPAVAGLLDWEAPKASAKQSKRPLTWWRATFAKPKSSGPWALDLGGMNKGIAWVNGKCIGRYWLVHDTDPMGPWMHWMKGSLTAVPSGLPSQRYYHVPDDYLHADGRPNTVVLFEELGGTPADIRFLRRA